MIAMLLAACQTVPSSAPAVLAKGDAASLASLKAHLAKAVGREQIQLGAGDPTQTSVISVLPPPAGPANDRNMAMPTVFRLEIEGKACVAVRDDTGARVALDGVNCTPAG
jgi:hypothetical protein